MGRGDSRLGCAPETGGELVVLVDMGTSSCPLLGWCPVAEMEMERGVGVGAGWQTWV
jgi:hypothetical protein